MILEQRGNTPAATTCATPGHTHRAPAEPAPYAPPATTGIPPGRQPGAGSHPEPPWAALRQVQRTGAHAPAVTARGRGNAPPPAERTAPAGDAAAAAPVSEAAVARWPSAMAAAADVTLADVRRAYPTWRAWPTTDGYMAQAVLVPSLTVRAATAPGLLHEIEAGIDARRGGGTR